MERIGALPGRQCAFLVTCAFLLIGIAVYGKSLGNGFVAFDDDTLVYGNPAVHELTSESIAWAFSHYDPELYIPLTFLSYQIDDAIGGGSPFAFHLTNLLLHVLNALLVTWIVTLFIGGDRKCRLLSVCCGLLFLLHPLNTEAVSWISARKDLLSSAFFFGALVAYLSYQHRPVRRLLWLTALLFLLGLLSKVSVIILPFVLLVFDWREGRLSERKSWTEKIPLFALGVIFGVVAVTGKESVLSDTHLLEAVLMAGKSTVFYLQKFLVPSDLSVIYPYTAAITLRSSDFFVPIVLLAVMGGVLIRSLHRTRDAVCAAMVFLLTLAPSFSNYAKAGDIYFASDRYAYMPFLGFLIGSAALLAGISAWRRSVGIIVFVALVTCGVLAHRQSQVWHDSFTLFSHTLNSYDDSHIAHNKVGAELIDRKEFTEGVFHLRRSLEIRPTARALYNLGIAALLMGEKGEARMFNEQAIALDPEYGPAYLNLSALLWEDGERAGALRAARKAVDLLPQDAEARRNLTLMEQ